MVYCIHDDYHLLNPYKGTALAICRTNNDSYKVIDVVLK